MGDPRNVAHAKKVSQEKHHKGHGKKTQPAKKPQSVSEESSTTKMAEGAKPDQKPDPTQLEKSLAILARLRELEFHTRVHIETLAELSLTFAEELKEKAS